VFSEKQKHSVTPTLQRKRNVKRQRREKEMLSEPVLSKK